MEIELVLGVQLEAPHFICILECASMQLHFLMCTTKHRIVVIFCNILENDLSRSFSMKDLLRCRVRKIRTAYEAT